MALANYADLQAAVGTWLHRGDLTAQVSDFIALSEFRLARDLRIAPLIAQGTVTIAAAGNSGALPTGCMEVVSAKAGGELRYITPETYDRALANANGVTTPLYYTVIGASLYVAPAWGVGGAVTLNYFRKEPALSASNTTNWYVTNAPDMLLYAALIEASPYIKDVANTQMWAQYYQNARDRLNDQFGVLDPYQRMQQLNSGPAKALAPSL